MTESNNVKTADFSFLDTAGMLKLINEEDKLVAFAVEKALPDIARAADAAYERLKNGGRMFYIGCGTSGRLGLIDASEIACTYGVKDKIFAVVAGGKKGISDAAVGNEDSFSNGRRAVKRCGLGANDVAVGLSASGRTPYVAGALQAAKEAGALTVGICNNLQSEISSNADVGIELDTGAEVIEGSTRMKAGTSQKMVLNMLSTVLMTRLGKVYKNYMIHMTPYNEKLKVRAARIVASCSGCDEKEAEKLLKDGDYKISLAIVMAKNKCGKAEAEQILTANGGKIE